MSWANLVYELVAILVHRLHHMQICMHFLEVDNFLIASVGDLYISLIQVLLFYPENGKYGFRCNRGRNMLFVSDLETKYLEAVMCRLQDVPLLVV